MSLESKYQDKIRKNLEKEGWVVIRLSKVTMTGLNSGIPDLLALKKSDNNLFEVKFIEVKGKKGKASPLQKYALKYLNKLGFNAYIDKES